MFGKVSKPAAGVIILATLIAYIPAMQGGFIWDDDQYVTENQTLRTWGGLGRIWVEPQSLPQWYSLVHTTYWVEYHLWGLRPFGYHLVNVLLHGLNAVMLWLVLRRLGVPGAWLAGLIFAVHPVHAESVAWITERKNVLSGLFYLLALLGYLRFLGLGREDSTKAGKWWMYAGALVLFVCSLLAKSVTASLPAAILLLIWMKRGRVSLRDVMLLLPFLAIGAGLGLHTAWMERAHVGAMGQEWDFSLVERVLIAGRGLWFYAGKLAWPVKLTFIYPRWEIDAARWWQYLFVAGAVAVVGGLWGFRRRMGRGPLVAVLFFAGTLAPALGFLNVYPMRFSFVADHFQYLASAGLIGLFAAVLTIALDKSRLWGRHLKTACAIGLAVALGVLTWRQGGMYRDEETLWVETIRRNSKALMAYNNLGSLLYKQDRFDEALEYFEQGVRLSPDYPKLHNNIGLVLVGQGKIDLAVASFSRAVELAPERPDAHLNLGNALFALGDKGEAARQYREVLRPGAGRMATSDRVTAANNLAWILATAKDEQLRDGTEAVQLAERACELGDYKVADNLDTLAAAYAEVGDFGKAVSTARRAVGLAQAAGQEDLARQILGRLELYQTGRAFRE